MIHSAAKFHLETFLKLFWTSLEQWRVNDYYGSSRQWHAMSCYLASAYITNIIWLIRITNLCSSKREGVNAKISEPKTTKQTFVSRCTWASYEAFWKVRPWFRKQWQSLWSISTMRKTLSTRKSHEGFRARELRGSKDDLYNACCLW